MGVFARPTPSPPNPPPLAPPSGLVCTLSVDFARRANVETDKSGLRAADVDVDVDEDTDGPPVFVDSTAGIEDYDSVCPYSPKNIRAS